MNNHAEDAPTQQMPSLHKPKKSFTIEIDGEFDEHTYQQILAHIPPALPVLSSVPELLLPNYRLYLEVLTAYTAWFKQSTEETFERWLSEENDSEEIDSLAQSDLRRDRTLNRVLVADMERALLAFSDHINACESYRGYKFYNLRDDYRHLIEAFIGLHQAPGLDWLHGQGRVFDHNVKSWERGYH